MILYNDQTNEYELYNPEMNFDPSVKENLNGTGNNICHSWSISAIEAAVCNNINPINVEGLENIFNAVFLGEEDEPFYHDAEITINNIIGLQQDHNLVTNLLRDLMYYLNNSISNLRYGDSSWNQSIGNVYDPGEWCYVANGKVISNSTNENNEGIDLYIKDKYGEIKLEDGFYLLNESDGARIGILLGIKTYKDLRLHIYKGYKDFPFLYSSSNLFSCPKLADVEEINSKIFYKVRDGVGIELLLPEE